MTLTNNLITVIRTHWLKQVLHVSYNTPFLRNLVIMLSIFLLYILCCRYFLSLGFLCWRLPEQLCYVADTSITIRYPIVRPSNFNNLIYGKIIVILKKFCLWAILHPWLGLLWWHLLKHCVTWSVGFSTNLCPNVYIRWTRPRYLSVFIP